MEHSLQNTMALLSHTPATLNALLRDLPEAWTLRNEGVNTMSPFDVIVHLTHAERTNWMPRVRMILQFGEGKSFEPFDRWGRIQESRNTSIGRQLDDFAAAREESLRELRGLNLGPEDLERRGQHPALGIVTLSQLLASWTVHDLTHLHQISRSMAHQYREAVGPWEVNLGVLRCAGHSNP